MINRPQCAIHFSCASWFTFVFLFAQFAISMFALSVAAMNQHNRNAESSATKSDHKHKNQFVHRTSLAACAFSVNYYFYIKWVNWNKFAKIKTKIQNKKKNRLTKGESECRNKNESNAIARQKRGKTNRVFEDSRNHCFFFHSAMTIFSSE